MRSHKIQSTDSIDFESGEPVKDTYAEMRRIQKQLYRIDNPYIGSKRKIVLDIAVSLEKDGVKFNTMLDLFSGSSVVSIFFKMLGKRIVANDLLTSSYHNSLAFVANNKVFLSDIEIEFLCKNNHPGKGDFVQKNYADRFTLSESVFLDNYRANVDILLGTPQHGRIKEALAIVMIQHYIMSRCFLGGRLNNGQVLAKIDHRISHNRNKSFLHSGEMTFERLPSLPIFDSSKEHDAYNMDAEEFLSSNLLDDIELVYLDPPYGSAQSDYASMFQFFEEYVHRLPIEETKNIKNAKKFCSAKEYEEHFRDILIRCRRFPYWAISYNDSSWADVEKLTRIISDYKKHVKVVNIDYEYKYRKDRGSATEYLFIAK